MSKLFYKEYQWIKFCKICNARFLPQRFSWRAKVGLCYKCLKEVYYPHWYKHYYLPYFNRQTPERQQELKKDKYNEWKRWVAKNLDKRRLIALISYHRHKHDLKNKMRKHRATKKSPK